MYFSIATRDTFLFLFRPYHEKIFVILKLKKKKRPQAFLFYLRYTGKSESYNLWKMKLVFSKNKDRKEERREKGREGVREKDGGVPV